MAARETICNDIIDTFDVFVGDVKIIKEKEPSIDSSIGMLDQFGEIGVVCVNSYFGSLEEGTEFSECFNSAEESALWKALESRMLLVCCVA